MKDKELIITPNYISFKDNPSLYVMMDWEDELMKEHSLIVTKKGGDILEIGFGMGISATYINQQDISSYTVVEIHPEIVKRARKWAKDYPNVTILEGSWHDLQEEIKKKRYDGIFYDAYQDKVNFHPFVKEIIKDKGIYTYFSPGGVEILEFRNNTKKKLIKIDPTPNDYYNKKECYVIWVEDPNNIKEIIVSEQIEKNKEIQNKKDNLIKYNKERFGTNQVLYDNDGTVVEDKYNVRLLVMDGYNQTGYNWNRSRFESRLVECISLFKERPITALNIGIGGGRMSHRILEHHNVTQLDMIDINPKVLDVLHFFDTEYILTDPRVNIIIDDVHNFSVYNKKKYDFVFIDLLNAPGKSIDELLHWSFFDKLKNNTFKDDTVGVYWYHNFMEFMIPETENKLSNIRRVFKNVSLHEIPRSNIGTYFFFSDKYEWNINKIEI